MRAAVLLWCCLLLVRHSLGLATSTSIVLSNRAFRRRENDADLGVAFVLPPRSRRIDCEGVLVSHKPKRPASKEFPKDTSLAVERSQSGALENMLEVGLSTAGGFLNGAVLGYVFGLFGGMRNNPSKGMAFLRAMHAKAAASSVSWGGVCACFSGLGTGARVVRGREDRWNQIISSCGTGAVMCRKQGPFGMVQGCASYAGFSYLFDILTQNARDSELDFEDIPVERRKHSKAGQQPKAAR